MRLFGLLETQYGTFTSKVKQVLAKTLNGFNSSYGNNTIFGQFINVMGNAIQNIMIYIEDALTEQNIYTAQRKKSIYGLAAQSGYQPSTGKAAGVQLKLEYLPHNKLANIIIHDKESITCTQNGLTYCIILPQEIITLNAEKDNSIKYVYAVQGKFESQIFISDGGKYYTQNVKYNNNLDTDYFEVYINNELWTKVDSFYDMKPDGCEYIIKTSYTGGVDLVFGNNKYGRSLNPGDEIKINYLLHDGEVGNLDVNTKTYFVFNNNLTDVYGNEYDGNQIFNVTFASLDAVTSGTNSETTKQVREMVGRNSRSLVLADPENYKSFINKFSFCGFNKTWSEKGSLVINSLILKNYKNNIGNGLDYFNLKESDFILNDNQKNSIKNYIEKSGSQLAGITYNIYDPELCKYALYIYVKYDQSHYNNEYIEARIREQIGMIFGNLKDNKFVSKSDIINSLTTNIDGIKSLNLYFLSEKNERALQEGQYIKNTFKYNQITGTYKKSSSTIYLHPGENPNLGLDSHGNIYLENDNEFPVLLGGWDYKNGDQEVSIVDPLIIVFE